MKLTDVACKAAKPKDKLYKKSDGGGLYLLVKPDGAKLWRMKYRFGGKEKLLAFGVYPLISLADARDMREKARKLLAGGIDPSTAKKEEKRRIVRNAANTFKAVALEWHENQTGKWGQDHADNIMRRLEVDIFPFMGEQPIADIEPPELLDVLRKIEARGSLETASRARQTCGQVFRYGIQTGRCKRDPAQDLRGALKTRKTRHFAAMDSGEIPAFLAALDRNDARLYGRTRRAIMLSMLTFARPGEIRQARWQDIDLDTGLWTVPAQFMKMGRDHVVPLSRQALDILREQKAETGILKTDWVFPSQIKPKEPMSDGTVNRAIKRLGFGQRTVAHGFRALARTTIREQLGYDSEIIERQLAHKASGPLGEAYDRTQFLPQRKRMMQDWADYIDALASGGKVVPFQRQA